jgi:RND family efflux transporter MFP subunit
MTISIASTRTRALLAGALLSGLFGLGACGRKGGADQLPPAQGPGSAPMPALPSVTARSDEASAVSPTEGHTTGTTFPRAEAQIGPNAGGVISKILVKEGDKVRKGQVLFKQDTQDAALRVDQAKAALEQARVNLKATETEFNRTKSMFDQKAVSQMQWDQVQSRMDGARVGVSQAEVALNMANKFLGDGTVRSPLSGVVVAKLKSEGEMATMMPPTVVLVVQDQSVLELRFRLPEQALTHIKAGDQVRANFVAVGIKRAAKVSRIQPSVDARTRTVEVVAEIPNPDEDLRSGLLAEVEMGADEKTDGKPVGRAP